MRQSEVSAVNLCENKCFWLWFVNLVFSLALKCKSPAVSWWPERGKYSVQSDSAPSVSSPSVNDSCHEAVGVKWDLQHKKTFRRWNVKNIIDWTRRRICWNTHIWNESVTDVFSSDVFLLLSEEMFRSSLQSSAQSDGAASLFWRSVLFIRQMFWTHTQNFPAARCVAHAHQQTHVTKCTYLNTN